jgi:hypothetical protein
VHVPKFSSSFDGRVSTTQDIPLTAPFPTESWASAAISVRLHDKANFSATASALVVVQNAVQVPDEPSIIYAADLTTVTIASGDAAPKLYTAAVASPIGPMLRLVLRWTQGATAQGSVATFAISIDLVGRTA